MILNIDNSFSEELPADKITENYRRQVTNACFSFVKPKKTSNPRIIHYCTEMLDELGISLEEANSTEFKNIFTGNKIIEGTEPYAMCYGGHQFGHWAGQLGDGRAINLFEIYYRDKRWALQLKGAGKTPYSRTADGLAVLRSSIREYLCAEAMYHLGVPTTRSLSIGVTGDKVLRDIMYDGNPEYESGAVVCRVAESFIRFGNFEILAARKNNETLKKLADYTISHFYKHIKSTGKQKYIDFITEVRNKTIEMIVHWQRVGFVHGVMNTDNMSIMGLTIDYGPYGWLEGYDFGFTPNTTDAQHKRYRFGNQPYIGLWNLFKLVNALFPLIEDVDSLQTILDDYNTIYQEKYYRMMFSKLGLEDQENTTIIKNLEKTLHLEETDFTIFFRSLSNVLKTDSSSNALEKISNAFYNEGELNDETVNSWKDWFSEYIEKINKEPISDEERKQKMNAFNPKYVLRNYMAQVAIDAANKSNFEIINELYQVLKKPYDEQPSYEKWFAKRPEWARNKVGCSMLSCSS